MDSCSSSPDSRNIGRWVQLILPIVVIIIIVASIFPFLPQPKSSLASPELSVAGAATTTYPGGEAIYRLELLNHTDQILYDGVITITLPAGFRYIPGSTVALGEGWPLESREPISNGQSLTWGPYHLPAAGNKAHNPFGIHTMMHDCIDMHLHLEGARALIGNGGYVTQLFYGLDAGTTGPSQCAVNFVAEAYARNLIPILRLEGHFLNGIWQAPDPGPDGDYSEVARGFANFVAGLPRRDSNPLYIQVWNEPDLWIEWSNSPNANQYARFFVAVSNAIRRLGDGRIRVINGALTPGNIGFIDRMLDVPGFRDAFDAWSSHCYPYNHPAWYNSHQGTARYSTYTIDCYLEEFAIIHRRGRTDFKVILTETGYELGSNLYDFEGFPRINETNRASYIASAFADYWQNWPEIIAVTPFELSDSSGHWHRFDWMYPASPYLPHLQYDRVTALPKPDGGLEPYGFQIIFKARVDPTVPPLTYTSQLTGSERDGRTAYDPVGAPVVVRATAPDRFIYLPVIVGPARTDGPWYLSQPEPVSPGAIVPTDLLEKAEPGLTGLAATSEIATINLAGEPEAIAIADEVGLGGVVLADGRLEIVDLTTWQSRGILAVGRNPQAIATKGPESTEVYVSLENEVALVDLQTGQVIMRWLSPGRWRGLAPDSAAHRLFVADAENERLVVLTDDLSHQLAELPLDQQPDQLIFDPTEGRIYLSLPAAAEVIAVDADELVVTARASLTGGPILDLTLDAARKRLYALNLLSPTYRGITVLDASSLARRALVAGAGDFPLQSASSLALTGEGQLLTPETNGLWQITPDRFEVRNIRPGLNLSLVGGLGVRSSDSTVILLEPSQKILRALQ